LASVLVTASRSEQLVNTEHAWPTGVSVVSLTPQAAARALAGASAASPASAIHSTTAVRIEARTVADEDAAGAALVR
jgi:hypothetical protein